MIKNKEIEQTVLTERLFMQKFENGEKAAIAGYATMENEEIVLHATVLSPDGKTVIKHEGRGTRPEDVAKYVADQLKEQGALEIIQLTLQESDSQRVVFCKTNIYSSPEQNIKQKSLPIKLNNMVESLILFLY